MIVRRMRRLPLLGLLGAVACVSGTLRPVAPAAEFAVDASPPNAMEAMLSAVTLQGLPLRLEDRVAGVVETEYTDLGQYYQQELSQFPLAERLVRFRLIVVPAETGYGSTVAIEARYSPFMTNAENLGRRGERALPRDHPGMRLVLELQTTITERTRGQ